jgi:hypothetical protein
MLLLHQFGIFASSWAVIALNVSILLGDFALVLRLLRGVVNVVSVSPADLG